MITIGAVIGAIGGALSRQAVLRYQHTGAPASTPTRRPGSERHAPAPGLFEGLGALLCALFALQYSPPEVLAYWWLVVAGLALAYLDWTTQRLPNVFCLAAYLGISGFLTVTAAADRDGSSLLRAMTGGLALAAFLFVVAVISQEGMGMGDVKLAAAVGTALAWPGWTTLITGTLTALLLAALAGGLGIALQRLGPHEHIAFAPALLTATTITLLIQPLTS